MLPSLDLAEWTTIPGNMLEKSVDVPSMQYSRMEKENEPRHLQEYFVQVDCELLRLEVPRTA